MPEPSKSNSVARAAGIVFAVALALRIVAMIALGSPAEVAEFTPWRWGHEPASLADALVRGEGFSDPFGRGTGPSAWLTPLYPALVAACMRLFGGVTPGAAAALYTVHALASAATAPLLLLLGLRLSTRRAGLLAAWAWALHPLAIWYAVHKVWDTVLVSAAVAGFALLLFKAGREPRPRRAFGLGALFGLLLLLNPAPVALAPAILLYLVPLSSLRRALPAGLGFAAGAALVCAPWVARNLVVLGSPGLRSNLGVELYVGNNDLADGQHRFEYHPGWTDDETAALRAMGEAEYAASRGALAREWIAAHPRKFVELCVTRARIFWFGEIPTRDRRTFFGVTSAQDPKSWVRWVLHLATGVCGLLGALALARGRRAEALVCLGALLLFPLPYYVIHVLERYRFPIEPFLILSAAHLFAGRRGRAR